MSAQSDSSGRSFFCSARGKSASEVCLQKFAGFSRRFDIFPHDVANTASVIQTEFSKTSLPVQVAVSAASVLPSASAPNLSTGIHAQIGHYCLRLAESAADREAIFRLRFRVFNLEMGEGLESAYTTGLDADEFDSVCEHLLVEDLATRTVVGTYRMQSGETAERNRGYYSEQEFSFAPYEPLRPEILELGRASIDREHRTPEVLTLLWRGIAQYATANGLRYLLGCSSVHSKNPREGWQIARQLKAYRCAPEFETGVKEAYACPCEQEGQNAQTLAGKGNPLPSFQVQGEVQVPKLLRTYLTLGARIAAPPAWDRAFGTIDFLTLLDLRTIAPAARHRFLAPLTQ